MKNERRNEGDTIEEIMMMKKETKMGLILCLCFTAKIISIDERVKETNEG